MCGGGGGVGVVLSLFLHTSDLAQLLPCAAKKNWEFQEPQKIFEFFATQNFSHSVHLL